MGNVHAEGVHLASSCARRIVLAGGVIIVTKPAVEPACAAHQRLYRLQKTASWLLSLVLETQ